MTVNPADHRSKYLARLGPDELDVLTAGVMGIRHEKPLDDVAHWGNAVPAPLAEERA